MVTVSGTIRRLQISRLISFATPTADTGQITAQLVAKLGPVCRPQTYFHRANVLLHDLISQQAVQADLFGEVDLASQQLSQQRGQAIDQINARYGKQTIHYAAEDLSQAWQPKHGWRSPRYTNNWAELPQAQTLKA